MSKTKFKGVCPHPKRAECWFAQINCAGKTYNLGLFDAEQGGEEAAARAFDNAVFYASKYRGGKTDYNFPSEWDGDSHRGPTGGTTALLERLSADESVKTWLAKSAARQSTEARKTEKALARLRKIEAQALIHEIWRALAFPDVAPRHPEALKKQINYVFGVELCQLKPSATNSVADYTIPGVTTGRIAPAPCAPQPPASVSAPEQSQPPVNAPRPTTEARPPALATTSKPLRRLQSVLPTATAKKANLAGRPRRFRSTVPRTAAPVTAAPVTASPRPSAGGIVETLPPDDPMPNRPDAAGVIPAAAPVPASPRTQEALTEMLTGEGAESVSIDHRAPRRPPKGTTTGPVLF